MHWLRVFAVLSLALLFSALPGQQPSARQADDLGLPPKQRPTIAPQSEGPQEIKPFPTPDSGIKASLRDLAPAAIFGAPAIRYVWIPSADEEDFKAAVLALNYVSRASFVYRPDAVPCPGGVLAKVDLRVMFPREQDLIEGIRTWEEFRFDPQSSLLLTKDILELAHISPDLLPKVKRKGARREKLPAKGDEPATEILVPFEEEVPALESGVDVVRLDAPDVDQAAFAALRAVTFSEAPIVEYRYFMLRALSTIKDDGPFKTIFGGLYYDLRGIHKAKDVKGKEKATDEDLFFEQLGIGNIAAGETYERLLDRVRGDLRPSVFISDVTGKPRAVVGFHTPAEREGGSWGGVTWDVKDKSIDARQHPVLSQIKPKIDAQEAIFPTASGMPIFAAFNGEGALQDEVPFDVAVDRTIPSPHPTRLQAAIGCIRCHGPEETWKPLRDDVASLFKSGRLSVFGDLTDFRNAATDSQDRIIGLHTGNSDRLLSRARDDFDATVLKVTGPWKRSKDQVGLAKLGAAKIADVYGSYIYSPVDARAALLDCGLDVPAGKAADVLTKLLAAENPAVLGIQFEDVRLSQLAAGGKIGRRDFSLIRSFAAGRVNRGIAKLLAEQGKKP